VDRTSRLVDRLHTAADLWATGVTLQREAIRRRHPDASDQDIEAQLNHWLMDRPGAKAGDGPNPGER
jgi:hypothetical protein